MKSTTAVRGVFDHEYCVYSTHSKNTCDCRAATSSIDENELPVDQGRKLLVMPASPFDTDHIGRRFRWLSRSGLPTSRFTRPIPAKDVSRRLLSYFAYSTSFSAFTTDITLDVAAED